MSERDPRFVPKFGDVVDLASGERLTVEACYTKPRYFVMFREGEYRGELTEVTAEKWQRMLANGYEFIRTLEGPVAKAATGTNGISTCGSANSHESRSEQREHAEECLAVRVARCGDDTKRWVSPVRSPADAPPRSTSGWPAMCRPGRRSRGR